MKVCKGSGRRFSVTRKEYEQYKRGMRRDCPVCGLEVKVELFRNTDDDSHSVKLKEHTTE